MKKKNTKIPYRTTNSNKNRGNDGSINFLNIPTAITAASASASTTLTTAIITTTTTKNVTI